MDYNLKATITDYLTLRKEKGDSHVVQITAEVPPGSFIAITEDTLSTDGKTRSITIQIEELKEASGGTSEITSSAFSRIQEKKVIVTMLDATGKQVGITETNFGL